jgi:hypothetical protein
MSDERAVVTWWSLSNTKICVSSKAEACSDLPHHMNGANWCNWRTQVVKTLLCAFKGLVEMLELPNEWCNVMQSDGASWGPLVMVYCAVLLLSYASRIKERNESTVVFMFNWMEGFKTLVPGVVVLLLNCLLCSYLQIYPLWATYHPT